MMQVVYWYGNVLCQLDIFISFGLLYYFVARVVNEHYTSIPRFCKLVVANWMGWNISVACLYIFSIVEFHIISGETLWFLPAITFETSLKDKDKLILHCLIEHLVLLLLTLVPIPHTQPSLWIEVTLQNNDQTKHCLKYILWYLSQVMRHSLSCACATNCFAHAHTIALCMFAQLLCACPIYTSHRHAHAIIALPMRAPLCCTCASNYTAHVDNSQRSIPALWPQYAQRRNICAIWEFWYSIVLTYIALESPD